jgi:glycosyltransferase involved in cell wall biosynthesis
LPPRADVLDVVKDCAMFVSSSDYEGLSNSMLEAMAIGLPCVCTDCLGGGARELIKDGENGLLVPTKDAKALAEAMCSMVDDKELSKRCSDNASKIREELSAEYIADKWHEYIESVI